MKRKQHSLSSAFLSVTATLFVILACQATNIFSTATPVPTQTPYPTYTPYPTNTPYPSFTVTPAHEELLYEDFEGNSSCFVPFSDSNANTQIEGGVFSANIVNREQSYSFLCANRTFSDFTLEVDVSIPEDTIGAFLYGIVFRESGGQSYQFSISTTPDGSPVFCLAYSDTDTYAPLTSSSLDPGNCWTKIPVNIYKAQWNTLRVSTRGEIIETYLNDEILVLTRDDLLAAGRIGFIVGTFDQEKTEVVYDNLRISEP